METKYNLKELWQHSIEPWNCLGRKSPLRSLGSTIPPKMPRPPLNPVPQFCTHTPFKSLQGWRCHHCPVPGLGSPLNLHFFCKVEGIWVPAQCPKFREFRESFQGTQLFANLSEERKIPRNSHLSPLLGDIANFRLQIHPAPGNFFLYGKDQTFFPPFFFQTFLFKIVNILGFFDWHLVQGQTILLHYHSVPPALPACPLLIWVHFTWIWAWKFSAWTFWHEKLFWLRGLTFTWNLPLLFLLSSPE